MRVLHLLASPGPTIGGMERQVALLSGSMGSEPLILNSQINGSDHIDLAVIADPSYAGLFALPGVQFLPLNLKRSRHNPLLLWDLARTVRQFNPEIIHAHGHKAAVLCAALKQKFPALICIATVHGTKRNSSHNNRIMAKMDAVIAVSQGVADALKPLASTVIHNALPPCSETHTRAELCQQWQLDPDKPILAAAGRLIRLKRYDRLIDAVRNLDVQLLIFGDGPKRAELEYMKGAYVRMAGHIDNVRPWLPAVDLFVICSEREGLSLAMLEALQAGVPVLSTPVSGATELLPETALIRDASVKGITTAICNARDHEDALRAALAPVFDRVKNELTPERLVAQTLELYGQLVDRNGGAQILCLGDCNTLGTPDIEGQAYPEKVAQALGTSIHNCGHTMTTTREGWHYFERFYSNATAQVVVLQYGLVDSWRTFKYAPYVLYYPDHPLRKFARKLVKKYKKLCQKLGLNERIGVSNVVPLDEYRATIARIAERIAPKLLILVETVPNHDLTRNHEIRRYNAALRQLATQHDNIRLLELYDEFLPFLNKHDAMYSDPTHLSLAGHQRVADKLAQLIQHELH